MTQKVHCGLFDVLGVDWSSLIPEQVDCIITQIHELELMGGSGELYGFVGTTHIEGVVGGFFIIQFPTELLSYNRDRTPLTEKTSPAEKVLFVLFLEYGKLLLQNRHFQFLPIDMAAVHHRIKMVFAQVFGNCEVGHRVMLVETSVLVERADLFRVYESSRRVFRLEVSLPNAHRIPEDFIYYNPERDRNAIIRDSRLHDYPKLRKITLTAKEDADLRDTHIGSDLVYTVPESQPFVVEYRDQQNQKKILRRLVTPKLEFHIDMDSPALSREALLQVIEIANREAGFGISIHLPHGRVSQPSLFDSIEGNSDE